MSTEFVPEEEGGRPRRVLALDFYGQLEDYSRAGATIEYVPAEGADFPGGLTRLRLLGDVFSARAQEDRFIIGATADGGSFQPNSRLPSARRTKTSRIWMTSSVGSTISATCSNWAMLPHFLEIRWNATQSFAGDSPIGEPT